MNEADFITDKKYITTAKLPELITEWKARGEPSEKCNSILDEGHVERNSEWEGHAKTKIGRYYLITSVLKDVQSVVKRYCYGKLGSNISPWGVKPEVSLSIVILRCALKNAALSIYDPEMPRTRQLWGTHDILRDRFHDGTKNWCSGEINALINSAEIDGPYYLDCLSPLVQEKIKSTPIAA
ncbi:hypothetical protein BDD12DRAFT_806788 [Trichophaea hybrida]|nr:hypothetical protein BDD12DRAFT_806788 [Trichophaea hybrida]